jgi:signal peptidase II
VRILFVTLFIVLADQVTKLLVKGFSVPLLGLYHQGMQLGQSFPVIGDFVRLTFVENPGMAFGIEVSNRLIFSLFTLVASIAIFYYIYRVRKEQFIVRFTLAMILGGAIGNLIDRIFYGVIFGEAPLFYGKVVDFVDMDFFNINLWGYHMNRFAIFNVADASVSTGIVLLLLFYNRFTAIDQPSHISTDTAEESTATQISLSDSVKGSDDVTGSSANPS